MGKTYIDVVKYIIYADLEVSGNVEKPDVIGAIFGQTEGLLGGELDLRELQKSGKIGRIDVELKNSRGKTRGIIKLPSSLGMVETAVIGAALETIDRIGPYEARIRVTKIEDARVSKRRYVIDRAKELLKKMLTEEIPETKEILESVKSGLRISEITTYGPEKLPAGPEIDEAEEIIVVEGRADVINLLKHGIKNVIALNGVHIPKTIIDLSKRKKVTLFVDGDRGGEMIARQMTSLAKVDYIARAPDGKEVEELTQKEILKCLRNKKPVEKKESVPEYLMQAMEEIRGTLSARLYDEEGQMIEEVPVRDLLETLKKHEKVHAIVFDGIITQRLVDTAKSRGVKYMVGVKVTKLSQIPEDMVLASA